MKKIAKNGNKRKFWVSLLLMAAIASVALTMALAVAQTGAVTNTFAAADHSTGIEEQVDGELNKDVTIKNNGESDAFIRVRIVVSPKEKVGLVFEENAFKPENPDGYWIADKGAETGDGFYYFSKPVKYNESTTQLLDAVAPEKDFKEMFDVTVYEESCVALDIPEDIKKEADLLEFIKNRFAVSEGTQK